MIGDQAEGGRSATLQRLGPCPVARMRCSTRLLVAICLISQALGTILAQVGLAGATRNRFARQTDLPFPSCAAMPIRGARGVISRQ